MKKIFDNIKHFCKTNRLAEIGAIIVVLFILIGVFAPLIAPYDPYKIDLRNSLAKPSSEHLFGTDHNGRDVLSRVIYGARISLVVAICSVVAGSFFGVLFGLIAGWYPKTTMVIMRLADVLLSFPGIIIALTIIAIMGADIRNVIVAVAVGQIPQFTRLVYGQVLSLKEREFVLSDIAVGATDVRILIKGILPNMLATIIVQMSIYIPSSIMTAASLSFLGLGVRPPTAEWGGMLQESVKWYRQAPHLMVFPGLALMLVVFGFNTLGDGLRVALDPRMKNR